MAEAKAVRRIIENRFGKDLAADKRWLICGGSREKSQEAQTRGKHSVNTAGAVLFTRLG